MRATFERDAGLAAVAAAAEMARGKQTIPVLGSLLITATDGGIVLRGTDLDRELQAELPAKVATPGAVCAAALQLADFLRNLPTGGEVVIAYEPETDPRLAVSCGRARVRLPVLSVDEFPRMDQDGLPPSVTVGAKDLKRLLDKTLFAVSTEATRYYLCGVYLHVLDAAGEARLCAVATNGHQLGRAHMPAPEGLTEGAAIVPTKTVQSMLQQLDAAGAGEAGLAIGARLVQLTTPGRTLTSKVVDGTFPDYQRVIPRDNPRRLRLDRGPLAAAVKRLGVVSGAEKERGMRLSLSPGLAVLSARSSIDSGDAREEIEADFEGEAFEVGFNQRYVLDVLGLIAADYVEVMLGDNASPALVTDAKDPDVAFVIMPMRV